MSAGSNSKEELSKEEITSLLHAFPSNGERLNEEHIQRSILQLVIADQQWWSGQGKAALRGIRQFVENNPRSDLAVALTSFSLKAAAELQAAIQRKDAIATLVWEEVLAVATPAFSEAKVWTFLLRELSPAKNNKAYEQWWKGQGKTAVSKLRPLAIQHPQSALATAFASFVVGTATEVQTVVQVNDTVSLALQLDILASAALPASEADVWMDLLQKLSQAIRSHAYDTYSWELRASLLQAWGNIPSLLDSPRIHSWLDVRWSELEKLLSLNLPEPWCKTAITMLLSIPLDIPPRDVINIVTYYTTLFEEVLQGLMRAPATRKVATRFFATLAEHGYPRKVQLLEALLVAGANQQESVETLLASACLEPRDVINLLENHCKSILSEHPLTPTLLGFLRQYLSNFDVDDLALRPARELLQLLQQRHEKPMLRLPADVQAYVQGWCSIARFIEQPAISKQWLSDVAAIPHLTPDTQMKLTAILVPRLVELVSTEADLCRVLDKLGQALIGQGIGAVGPGLLLLEQMAGVAGRVYGRERPPVRLIPYIKIAFGETHFVPSPEKEECIHRCLPGLLAYIDAETLMIIDANAPLWPLEIQVEWRAYLATRQGLSTHITVAGGTAPINLTSSLAEDDNQQQPAATVNEQHISFEQFRKMYFVKSLYLQYDSHVQKRIAAYNRVPVEIKEPQAPVENKQFRQAALNDLVNDVLIQEEIAELIKQNSSLSLNFDTGRQLSPIFQDFKVYCGASYAAWFSSNQLNDGDVLAVLRIFIRQGLFDLYLQTHGKSLHSWLKECRKRAKIVVNISDLVLQ